MPTTGDNITGEDKVVLVVSLMSDFTMNFGEIIVDGLKSEQYDPIQHIHFLV